MEFYKILAQRSGVQIILQTIKDHGPISKRELQEKTNLSWGHISQVTRRFLEDGYIVVCEKEMTAGRSRELLDINGEDNFFIGGDLNSRRIRVVVTDMKGRVIEEVRQGWEECEYTAVLDTIFEVLDGITFKYRNRKIFGIGFAVQGIVDVSKGISIYIDKVKNWKDVRLKEILEERYGMETVIAHDPDCLMKCECCFGSLKNSNVTDAVLVHYNYGLGIGMSIMINGQIYIGHLGMAGEIGYTVLNTEKDGNDGLLMQFADKRDTEMDMQQLIRYIGGSIATVNSLFNPKIIVLHMTEPDYREEIVRVVKDYLQNFSYNQKVELRLSCLNKNAKALGAALILVDREIDRIV